MVGVYDPIGFTTTWDYTTLKRPEERTINHDCFTTTWDYTTLKLGIPVGVSVTGFTTTWDYTTLKLSFWNLPML